MKGWLGLAPLLILLIASTGCDPEWWIDDDSPSNPTCEPPPGACDGLVLGGSATEYPLVMAHGAAGWDDFGLIEYWVGIPKALRDSGYEVHVAEVDPFNHSDVRGPQLAAYIDQVLACTCEEKVNLIAHSQGGIDARYVISTMGYGDKVASLTTVATPHLGTPVADAALGISGPVLQEALDFFLWFAGEFYQDPDNYADFSRALELFSTPGMAEFNELNPNHPGVAYYSWAGRPGIFADGLPGCDTGEVPNPSGFSPIQSLLLPTYTLLGGLSGDDNDGLIPVWSAKWGTFRGCIVADHIRQIGHILGVTPGFDQASFYVGIGDHLASQGW